MLRKNNFILLSIFFLSLLPAVLSAKTVLDYTIVLNTKILDITIRVSLNDAIWREKMKEEGSDKSVCFEYDSKSARNFWAKGPLYNNLKVKKEKNKRLCVVPNGNTFTFGYKVPVSLYKGAVYSEESSPLNIAVNDSIIVFGKNTFLIPSYRDEQINPLLYLTVRRNNFKKLVSSIWLKNERAEINSPDDLLTIVLMAGDISIKNEKIEKKTYVISTSGSWKKGLQGKIIKEYKAIAQKQLSMWGFLPANFILTCFIRSKEVKRGFGFQYGNTIIYILPDKLDLNDPELLNLLAHEHFHIWNGSYYSSKEGAQNIEWFHEGLTNYYALISVVSAGLISEDDFLKYLSANYLKYDSSYNPAEAKKQKLLRDTFIVMAIEIEIIKASSSKKNLDSLIKNISRNSLEWTKGYDNQLIKTELVKIANWDISDFFDNYISSPAKLSMEPYFAYLGLKQSSDLVLQKYKETKQYKKFLRQKVSRKKGAR